MIGIGRAARPGRVHASYALQFSRLEGFPKKEPEISKNGLAARACLINLLVLSAVPRLPPGGMASKLVAGQAVSRRADRPSRTG